MFLGKNKFTGKYNAPPLTAYLVLAWILLGCHKTSKANTLDRKFKNVIKKSNTENVISLDGDYVYKKIDTKNLKDLKGLLGENHDTSVAENIQKIENYVKLLPSLPNDIEASEIGLLSNLFTETDRRKRAATSQILSNFTDGTRVQYEKFKNEFCGDLSHKSVCLAAFLEEVKTPKQANLGTSILKYLLKYFDNESLNPEIVEQFGELLNIKGGKEAIVKILQGLEYDLNLSPESHTQNDQSTAQTSSAPAASDTASQAAATTSDQSSINKKAISANAQQILSNMKLANDNQKKRIKLKHTSDLFDSVTINNLLEKLVNRHPYSKVFYDTAAGIRYLLINIYKRDTAIVYQLQKIKNISSASIYQGYHTGIRARNCCYYTTTNLYVEVGTYIYSKENCRTLGRYLECRDPISSNELSNTCLFPHHKCFKKVPCESTELPLYKNNELEVDFIPLQHTALSVYSLIPNKHYRISSKREEVFTLHNQRIKLLATPHLEESFKVEELSFDLPNICAKEDKYEWFEILSITNAVNFALLSGWLAFIVICYKCSISNRNLNNQGNFQPVEPDIPLEDIQQVRERRVVFGRAQRPVVGH